MTSQRAADQFLHKALDLGINLVDTADIYGQGDSERALKRVLRNQAANKLIVATKAGHTFTRRGVLESTAKRMVKRAKALVGRSAPAHRQTHTDQPPAQSGQTAGSDDSAAPGTSAHENYSPEYLRASLHESLRRLGREQIDIYQLHSPPPSLADQAATWDAMRAFKAEGLIRFWGISCFQPADVLRLGHVEDCDLVQFPAHAGLFEPARTAADAMAECGVGKIGRQPFAHGRLLSADASTETLLRLALHHTGVDTLLVGTSSTEHLKANLAAADAGPLDEQTVDGLTT